MPPSGDTGRVPVASRMQVLAAAALFSTGGAAIKACAFDGLQVASLRSGIAALVLPLLLGAARRGWGRPRTWLVAAAYAATLVLFVTSTKLTTAANAIFLQSTAPLWILVLGPWLLAERFRGRDLAFLGAAAAGLAVLFAGSAPASATAPDPAAGNLLALGSSVTWAFTVMGLRWLERSGSGAGLAAAAAGNLLAFAAVLPWAWPIPAATASDWLVLGWLGVFQIGLAYLFLTRGLGRVRALETSLLLLIEPVLNPLWTWLAHGENPGVWSLAGGAVVLGAVAAKAVVDTRTASASDEPHASGIGPRVGPEDQKPKTSRAQSAP